MRDFKIVPKDCNPFHYGWIFGLWGRPRDPDQDHNIPSASPESDNWSQARLAWLDGYDMAVETLKVGDERSNLLVLAIVEQTSIEWE